MAMAKQGIEFTITTVDKATAMMNKINKDIAKMTRPFENVAKSVQRFSKASGLTEVSKRLGNVAQEAGKVAASMRDIAAPMLALVGGGTIAVLSALVVQWERIGAETARTARMLGTTADELTRMRASATLMGTSADTLTAGFQSLQDTLQDAKWGRNQAAFATLQALGITLRTTKAGIIDTKAAMYALADRMQRLQRRDPAATRNLARSLGVEQLLPVLIQGREGLQAYEKEAARLRGDFTPDMAKRAEAFALSLNKMGVTIDGLKASIADKLAPVLQPLIERFTEWIAANRELLAQKIANVVQSLADWLQRVDWERFARGVTDAVSGVLDFVAWVGRAVDKIGGWKAVAVAIATYLVGGFVLSIGAAILSIVLMIYKLRLLVKAWKASGDAATQAAQQMEAAANDAAGGKGGGGPGRAGGRGGRLGRVGRAFRGGLKAGGAIAAIGAGLEAADVLTSDASASEKKRGLAGAAASGAGTAAGTAAGAVLGTLIAPGVGTAIGAYLGGTAGEWIGRKLGDSAGEALFKDERAAKTAETLTDAGEDFSKTVTDSADVFVERCRTGFGITGGGAAVGIPAGATTGGTKGVGGAARAWASQLDFAGKERRYGLPAGLLTALAQQESGGNPNAVSKAGAAGLFQFMPATAKEYGINAFDPAQSAEAAAKKMGGLMKRYRGNLTAALSAYNWGEGNLERKGLASAPAETRAYAPAVLARMGSLNSPTAAGEAVPTLNPPMPAGAGAAAGPVVHVDTKVHVERDGRTTVRTQTPSGLKIARPMLDPTAA